MSQAKGVLPRGADREVLYKNPRTCGYFVSLTLDATIDRPRAEALLGGLSPLIDELVARLPADGDKPGDKVAAVAVGLAPSFFTLNGQPRFNPPLAPPAGFRDLTTLPSAAPGLTTVPVLGGDLFLYIASTFEARVNAFLSKIAAMKPDVAAITFDRGYQRVDGTEPFGYADGLRNIRTQDRPEFVFVHRDTRELEEPEWCEGGSYMAFARILQRPDQFAALSDDSARDTVIGRTKQGTRLDLTAAPVDPRAEPSTPAPAIPPSSHVRKAGPREGRDDNQIFRRGLPFMETSSDGRLRIGLNFCSFQSSLDRLDVVLNDWMFNPHFPADNAGVDALFDPSKQLTAIEKIGFFFVPPHDQAGLAHAVFGAQPAHAAHITGKCVVHKRIVDPTDPSRRFERRGFNFQILDAQQQPVAGSQFTTDSTGRGICPIELTIGQNYFLQEVAPLPVQNVQPVTTPFAMDAPSKELQVLNQVTQPNTPYGSA